MVKIITDSAADFEPRELEDLGIACIPITVIFGDEEYQENVNLSKDQFYRLLETSPHPPQTAQPSPAALMDLFQQAEENGDEAVYITISSGISGTYQNAQMTLEMSQAKGCYVLDGRNATGGQRMLVEYAVKLRDEGKSAQEIVELVGALREKVTIYACIDTLEYLYRGGRINRAIYKVGTLAQVKPIIRVSQEGTIEIPSKAMGIRKGMDFLCKQLTAQPPCPDFPLYILYTAQRHNAEALAARFRELGYDIPDSHLLNLGAAIGSHIGPGGCGMVYVRA